MDSRPINFRSVQKSIFGTLIVDGNMGTIKRAEPGWAGNSDLHIRLDASNRAYFKSNPFPVSPDQDSELYSFLPYINFHRLPRLDFSGAITPSIPDHLRSMFSQHKRIDTGDRMAKIKHMIHRLLLSSFVATDNMGYIIRLTPLDDEDMPTLLLIKGVYLDYNSESLVGEGYVLPITPDNASA